jgi:hypothetical protein
MPVLTATQETVTQRIVGGSQPEQKVSETPAQQASHLWWCMPVTPAMQYGLGSRSSPARAKARNST